MDLTQEELDESQLMAPYLTTLKGSQETYLKSRRGDSYLVLEEVPLSVFLTLPPLTQVVTTTYGHYEPESVVRIKGELLADYRLVLKESIPL